MTSKILVNCLAGVVGFLASVGTVYAGTETLNAVDRGNYDDGDLFRTGFPGNYQVGDPTIDLPNEVRNFFIFDLSSVSGTIISAELRLFNPAGGYLSGDLSETYELHDVANLTNLANHSNSVGVFAATPRPS